MCEHAGTWQCPSQDSQTRDINASVLPDSVSEDYIIQTSLLMLRQGTILNTERNQNNVSHHPAPSLCVMCYCVKNQTDCHQHINARIKVKDFERYLGMKKVYM